MSVSGDVNEATTAEIGLDDAIFSAGSLELHGYDLQGSGTVTVTGDLTVDQNIIGNGLTVTAGRLSLGGSLIAEQGGLTVNASAAGVFDLSDGALTGGTYQAVGVLNLNFGAVPTTDAATLDLAGGSINVFNPATDAYQPIQTALTTIASGGVLEIGANQTTQFNALTDNGAIELDDAADFAPGALTIGAEGKIYGSGTLAAPTVNNGVIDAAVDDNLIVSGAVSGPGHFEIEGSEASIARFGPEFVGGTLELVGPQTENVVLTEGSGALQLDDPASFMGDIVIASVLQAVGPGGGLQPNTATFEMKLGGVDYSLVTGYAYRSAGASGVLTIDTTAGDYSFNFTGNLQRSDFTLAAGPQTLSTLPPSLDITVTPQTNLPASRTPADFSGDGLSDVLWRNANGDVAIWNTTAGAAQYVSVDEGDVSGDWRIAGVGDFNGASGDGVLWRNANGDLTTWNASPSGPESFGGAGGATYDVSTDWQVAGVGDFNGDGLSDILWRNANGAVDVWNADPGSSPASFSAQSTLYVSPDWQIGGVGDFDGVGADGVLWRNTTSGDVTIWNDPTRAETFVASDLGAVSLDWSIAGVGNFTGDKIGQEDILWRNVNGDVALWTPNLTGTGYGSLDLGNVSTDWKIASVGDYNGDGKADILWRNANTGDVTIWESSVTSNTFKSVDIGIVSADWQVAAK